MELAFTLDQLTPEIIATVLNGAYINASVETYNEGKSEEFKVANVSHDGWQFQVYAGFHDAVCFKCYQTFDSGYGEDQLKQVADYMDGFPVDSTYLISLDGDAGHLMSFHYQHLLPEDEKLSPAYLVKLCRHFAKTLNLHSANWNAIEEGALANNK